MSKLTEKKKYTITPEIQQELEMRIRAFNSKQMARSIHKYVAQFKGNFIYLMSVTEGYPQLMPVFRLKYTGDIENLDFAIFKYSSEKYDPEEWGFPGTNHIDGTIEGAMKAGIKAYLS